MSTLTAPPTCPPTLAPSSASFTGHSLAAYTQFFALDLAALRGRDVLDVAAGASSFAAEAALRRVSAVAVDPLYGESTAALAARIAAEAAPDPARPRASRPRCRPGESSAPPAAAEEDRRAAAQRFLSDYEAHFSLGRYVGGGLPQLPFFDGTFDLVLCAQLRLDEVPRFDLEWHLAACRELVRVGVDEVRLYPILGDDGRPGPALPRLRRELKAGGITSQIVEVACAWRTGADAMLVLRRAAS